MSYPFRRAAWFRVAGVDVTTTVMVTALASLSILLYAIEPGLLIWLALVSWWVTQGEVWRLITWPLLNPPDLGVVFYVFVFFIFCRDLERMLGRDRLLWFLLILTAVPALGGVAYADAADRLGWIPGAGFLALGGISFLGYGVIAAYVAARPAARTFYDIPLWAIAVVIIGIAAVQFIGARAWEYLVFLALIVLAGLLESRAFGLSQLEWLPKLALPWIDGGTPTRSPRGSGRGARLRVVHPSDLDSLLDKITRDGIDSLTSEERRRLEQYRREGDS